MKERPLLFSAPTVRAILAGTKVQTRRIVKPQPILVGADRSIGGTWTWPGDGRESKWSWGERIDPNLDNVPSRFCPFGAVGGRLWVRETWAPVDFLDCGHALDDPVSIGYAADRAAMSYEAGNVHVIDTYAWNWDIVKWRPSIHMPRWASRIDLVIEAVRVERLQEITEEGARAEGVEPCDEPDMTEHPSGCVCNFRNLWDDINGKRAPWDANPWVWVLQFRRVRP